MNKHPILCSLAVAALLASQMLFAPVPPADSPAKAVAAPAPLQFQADQHVVGFWPTQVYFATLNHVLSVEFLGTAGVAPQTMAKNRAGLQPLIRVSYPALWPGVTVVYEGVENGLAQVTYQLAPGADPARIQLRYNLSVALQPDGALKFTQASGQGEFTQAAPVAWQDIEGQRQPVAVAFALEPNSTVGLRVGAHDVRYPLVIAPAVYIWHTFYGGSGSDSALVLALDANENIYIAGRSTATWLGDNGAQPLHPYTFSQDMVIVKLSKTGAYQWHTFYGGTNTDAASGLGVDANGNVYVAGTSAATWQGDNGTNPLQPYTGLRDIVVLKLSSTGSYQWHTFYGSPNADEAFALVTNSSGDVVVAGDSDATWQGAGNANPLHAHSGGSAYDIFIMRLSSTGSYQWHTFYGGTSYELISSLALDATGNIYAAGNSYTTWQGDNNANPLHPYGGGNSDMIILKLTAAGNYQWHTFYGGLQLDDANTLVVGNQGGVYITGYSYATWQGDGNTNPLHPHSGSGVNTAIFKLTSAGNYQWHTFYGGIGLALAVDAAENMYAGGFSHATWQGDNNANPLHPYSGADDIFLVKLTSAGNYQWHTFYGGTGSESAYTLAVDGSRNVYASGYSTVSWQGEGNVGPIHSHSGPSGTSDVVILRLAQPSTAYQLYGPFVVR